jgi:hypothetical protein
MNEQTIEAGKKVEDLWNKMIPIQIERQEIMGRILKKQEEKEQPTEDEISRLQVLSDNLMPIEKSFNESFSEFKKLLVTQ